jgi:hypothetical protein
MVHDYEKDLGRFFILVDSVINCVPNDLILPTLPLSELPTITT